MKKIQLIFLSILSLSAICSQAQLPDTDIFLFKAKQGEKKHEFDSPININMRVGYDNQPCFSPDCKELLFVSVIDSLQSDIWSYNIKAGSKKQITHSKESEYSPTFINHGKQISTVRVDVDSAQRFYLLDYPAISNSHFIENSDSIGYSCWVNDSLIAMFIVEDTMSLQLLDLKTHKRTFIMNNPGRCIKINPKNKLMYFVDKNDSTHWYLSTYDFKTNKTKRVIETTPGSEDFAFFSDGTLIAANGKSVVELSNNETAWDGTKFKSLQMEQDFYRIAISPDDQFVAVVSFVGKKP